jgi:hypothetical protein
VTAPVFPGRSFFHGTKAILKTGDLIQAGYASNYGRRATAEYVYLSGTLNAAIWGAELAIGEGPGKIYVVEAIGPIEDDPNLTDKKYPGNRHCPIAPRIRFVSLVRSSPGKATPPKNSRT